MNKCFVVIVICVIFLFSNSTNAQLFGGWILPSTDACVSGDGSGSSLANAAPGCKYIKDNYPASISGTYYLDVDGSAGPLAPFRGYCDMTNHGGGWLLISKSRFTTLGPSKVEMTGDVSLYQTVAPYFDPWSGGRLATFGTETTEFTTPTAPNYFPLGYRGNSLLTATDDLSTTAPDELYAIISRNIIEAYRTSPCVAEESSPEDIRLKTVIRQTQGTTHYFINDSKRFNPIQHKCASNNAATRCDGTTLTGCATGLIIGNYSTYDPITHTVSGLRNLTTTEWNNNCGNSWNHGDSQIQVSPAGWMARNSAFYDLSDEGGVTSGPISINAQVTSPYTYCPGAGNCPFTTIWLK